MLNIVLAGSLIATGLLAPAAPAPAPDPPPTDRVVIDVDTVNGSGCPAGTAAVATASDNTAFTVTYSDYLAQVGVGAKPTDSRKNCQLSLHIHVPQGFTFAISKADYRGFASLASGATGLQRANYYFMGESPTSFVNHTLAGPMVDNWQNTDATAEAALVYAPCGEERNLNVNTELRVSVGSSDPNKSTSFLTMDSTDGSIQTIYHFSWKHC